MSVLTDLAAGRQAYRGVERRGQRRYGLNDPADEDFTTALRARIRQMPPEGASDTKSWLQWAFDLIDAPRNVTANLINTVAGSPVRGGTRKGLFGLPEVSGGELLKKGGLDFGNSTAGSVGNFLADFGANVIMDPLSWLGPLSAGAKKLGGTLLNEAGQAAVRQGAEQAVGRRAARGLAELARRGAGDEARAAFRTAQETRLLERLGNRRIAQNLGEAATKLGDTAAPALGPAAKPMAREFARQRGAKELDELLARRVAREPENVARKGLAFGTSAMRAFHPLDLPLGIPAGLTGVVAPKFTQRFVAPVVEGVKKVTRPVLAPWQYLPKADLQIATSEQIAKLARSLGLPQAAEATGLAAVGRGVRAGAAEVGHELGKRFIGEPRPPRPNDAADLRRWELEKWEQFNAQATKRAQRAVAFDETRFVAAQRIALEQRLGLDPHTAGRIDAYLTEARGASDAPSKLYDTVGNMLEEGGYDRALAAKIVEGADDAAFRKGTGNREPGTGVAPPPPVEEVAQQADELPTGQVAGQDVPAETLQALVRHVESFNTIPAIRAELRTVESVLATPGIPLGRRASYEFIRTGLNAKLGHLERAALDAPASARSTAAERRATGPVDVQPQNPAVDNPGAMGFARAKLKAVRDGVAKHPDRTVAEARAFLLKKGYSETQADEFIANALRKPDLAPGETDVMVAAQAAREQYRAASNASAAAYDAYDEANTLYKASKNSKAPQEETYALDSARWNAKHKYEALQRRSEAEKDRYVDSLREVAAAELARFGFRLEYESAGSRYYVREGSTWKPHQIRVSTHAVPLTAEREGGAFTWAKHGYNHVLTPDLPPEKVLEEIRGSIVDMAEADELRGWPDEVAQWVRESYDYEVEGGKAASEALPTTKASNAAESVSEGAGSALPRADAAGNNVQKQGTERKPDLAPAGEWHQGRPPVSQLNLFGERIEVAPRQGTLFAPDDLRPRTAETPKHVAAPAVDPATVKPGLLEMVRGVLKEIPGNKIPTPTQVRNALIGKYGSGAVQDQMVTKLRGTLWEPELRAAIDTAERGEWMFGQKATGLDLAPRVTVGDKVTIFDSERRPYDAELRLIDLADETQRPLASHRAVGRKEITGLVSEERFPAGFQARERTSAASVAQVEGIRHKPVFELLLDVGPDATAGPPVLWRDPTAGLVVVQGNGRMIGMDRWDAATWEKYKAALAERVGADAVAGMKKPALVRVMSGGAQEARQLGAYGQEAIGLKQTMFEQARALLNSLSPEELGNIPAPRLREPVTRDNVVQLLDDPNNRRFREWLLRGLDDDQRRSLLASPDALAERVNTAFIAMLPAEVGRIAARGGAKMEQAFAAIAPMAARLSSLVREGTVRPQYDLYAALEGAGRILERGRKFKGGYAAFVRELDALEQTGRLAGFADGGDDVSLPGLAIATLLRQAENATDPAATVVTKLQNVLQTALADDPRQMAMFAVTPEETAALAYLTAAVGPNRAEQILQAAPTLRARAGQAAADIPATPPPAAATELAAPPPAAAATPPEKPPLTVEPGTPRARVYADLDRTAQTLGWAPQKTKLMYRVLGHFSDDAFRSLGIEAGTAADVADIRQRAKRTPAAAYWSGLSDADRAAVQADGLIQLFKHSEDYDDVGLLLEELNHHVYYNVLADAERAQITRWYQSRQQPEWADWLRRRGVRSELADYYAGSERELYARVFVDYAMGKEIDADPEVATLFEKVLRRIRDLYRDLTGSGEIGVDPRIEATFERFYSAPKPQQMEGVAPPAGGPGQLFGTREPVRVAQTPGPRPSVPEEPVRAGAPDELFDRGDPTSIGGPVLPQPGLTLAKDVQTLVDHLQARAWLRLQEAKASGAPVVRLVTERNVQYLRRVLAPDLQKPGAWATLKRVVTGQMLGDARTSLGEWFRRTSMSLFAPNQKGRLRNVREQMTHEINALVRRVNETLGGAAPADAQVQRIIAELDLRPGQKLGAFSEDPLLNHVLREVEHVKTIGSAEFINEIVRRHGVKIERNVPLPAGYVRVHAGQFGELTRDFALPIDAAALVEKHVKQWERPDRLLAGYNWILNKWKGLALIAPAYHMRNLWGNIWNASLGDGFDAKAWAEAAELLRAAAHGDAGAGRIAGTSLTRQELYRKLLVDEGLIGSGFYGVEFRTSAESVQKTIDAVLQPPSWKKFWQEFKRGNILRANQTAGQIIEDASKVGFVIARMRRGDTLQQAAAAAKKYLFDYGDITEFERGLRYVFPWYTWTRKNAELMLLTAAVQPWRLALVPKIQMTAERALAGDDRLPLSLRPEHVRRELGVQVGPLNSQGSAPFLNLGYLAPVQEARLFTPGAGEHVLEQAGGPWKAPVELAMNRDWYFDRPIQEYEGQRKEMLGVPMPPGLKHVARMVRPLNVAEQTARNIGLAVTPGEVAQTALQAATGLRTFNVDAARQVLQREYELNQQVGALKRDIRRRLRELPPGADAAQDPETRRLLGLYAQQMEQRDVLPGSMVRRQMAPGRRAAREQFAELTAGG